MFGLQRRSRPIEPTPATALTAQQIFDIVQSHIAALVGEHGTWVVERRTTESGDDIFHRVLAHSVSVQLAAALLDAQTPALQEAQSAQDRQTARNHQPTQDEDGAAEFSRFETGPVSTASTHEPAAFGWTPQPIARWTETVPGDGADAELIGADEHIAIGTRPPRSVGEGSPSSRSYVA